LKNAWGKTYSDKLLAIIYQKINLISHHPLIYEQTSITGLRKVTVSNYTSFYYQVRKEEIKVVFFLDNRQEPLVAP